MGTWHVPVQGYEPYYIRFEVYDRNLGVDKLIGVAETYPWAVVDIPNLEKYIRVNLATVHDNLFCGYLTVRLEYLPKEKGDATDVALAKMGFGKGGDITISVLNAMELTVRDPPKDWVLAAKG